MAYYAFRKPTHLNRPEVLEWFGRKKQFIDVHESTTKYYDSDVAIEDAELQPEVSLFKKMTSNHN